MKTVLIVEDEKMIRQGIRTMVQRSGVPIEIVMECSNGEQALEIVKSQEIDVMFTDIRMPKMDGIELVKEVSKLDNKPYMVAVSGFDDFSYAVEMLRNGVCEYILKPVERDKIKAILEKLEDMIQTRDQATKTELQIGQNQFKYLLGNEEVDEEELLLLEKKYEGQFFPEGYVICMASKNFEMTNREGILFIDASKEGNIAIVKQNLVELLLKNELWQECVGLSSFHQGIREVNIAYREAYEARLRAFYSKESSISYGTAAPKIPDGLIQQALKHTERQAWSSRVHLIGTDKSDELGNSWSTLFEELKRGHVLAKDFEDGIAFFLDEVKRIYKSAIDEEIAVQLHLCEKIYAFSDIDAYQNELMDCVFKLHERINNNQDASKNEQKMKQAIAYIEENYNTDLNMAVVSNYISMNYSMFSFEFKQYTGTNFVNYIKDLRMAEAKKLLAESDLKIIDISMQVGYENEKHFMKLFKQTFGVSPTEFRKNMKQE